MNNDALSDLKPLMEPPAISWWPPAPGWWLLGSLLLLSLVVVSIYGWKRWRYHRNTAYRREALQLVAQLDSSSPEQPLQKLAEILRRAAICAWGRERVGTCSWQEIIALSHSEYSKRQRRKDIAPAFDENSIRILANDLYRNTSLPHAAMQNLLQQSCAWLKTLPAVEQ